MKLVELARLAKHSRIWSHPIMRNPSGLRNALFGDPICDPPAHLQIELSSLCNLACTYCVQHAGKPLGALSREDTPSGFMTQKTFTQILDRHPQAITLQLQGQGEPLFSPQFGTFTSQARSRGMFVYTVSNGMSLRSRQQEMVLTSGLDAYLVSLDVCSPEDMQDRRIGLNYETVVRNIQELKESRAKVNSPLLIGISSVVLAADLHRLDLIMRKYDKDIAPDFMVVAPLVSCSAQSQDYTHWYSSSLREQVLTQDISLPDTRAALFTPKSFSHGSVCRQTRMRYYGFDGTPSYCQVRHKTKVVDVDAMMHNAAKSMLRGIVPAGCQGCSYFSGGRI